jgi:alkylated DNA nucleotide flippase Atl1
VIRASPTALENRDSLKVEVAKGVAPQKRSSGRSLRERLSEKAEEIPAGSWTSYGDIATMIASAALPVGTCLATWPIPNAHRVLNAKGQLAAGFAWRDGRTDDPVELLKAEGIRFTDGRADPQQRWRPDIGDLR